MSDTRHYLTDADVELLQEMIRLHQNKRHNPALRPFDEEPNLQPPEVYVALAPMGGIPALTGAGTDIDATATICEIYKLSAVSGPGTDPGFPLVDAGFTQPVYNLFNAVPANSWVLVEKDKYGTWWVSTSAGGGSSSTTPAQPFQSVQFNNADTFGGSGTFLYDTRSSTLLLSDDYSGIEELGRIPTFLYNQRLVISAGQQNSTTGLQEGVLVECCATSGGGLQGLLVSSGTVPNTNNYKVSLCNSGSTGDGENCAYFLIIGGMSGGQQIEIGTLTYDAINAIGGYINGVSGFANGTFIGASGSFIGSDSILVTVRGGIIVGFGGSPPPPPPPPAAPTVTNVAPRSGSTLGGDIITITGTNFLGSATLDFGSSSATFFIISSTQISATTPAESTGNVHVTVTNPSGTSSTTSADTFAFAVPLPVVASVSPNFGSVLGGDSITVTGVRFTGATVVDFGSSTAAFTVGSDTVLTAITPAEALGTIDIIVTTPGGTSAIVPADQFTFGGIPSVTNVIPRTGSTVGGDSINITGTGFVGVGSVSFGSSSAAFAVNSPTSITALTPAESAGTVDVRVANGFGVSPIFGTDTFTFMLPGAPTVTSILPRSGTTAGGDTVTISGSSLGGASVVQFGATTAASYVVNSTSLITAVTPAHTAGVVDVTVTTPSGTSATSGADQFSFEAAPTVTSLAVRTGSVLGGTANIITGTGFEDGFGNPVVSSVLFGSNAASLFLATSATSINIYSPAGTAGVVDVTVTTTAGTSATSGADTYTYTSPPPPPGGSTTITTSGTFTPMVTGSYTISCYGMGQGGGGTITGTGGDGGDYANTVLSLSPSNTITCSIGVVTGSVGTGNSSGPGNPGADTWASTTGSSPSNSSVGALAPGGASGTTAVGTTNHVGGSGGTDSGLAGGGGGGGATTAGVGNNGTNASGATAGVGGNGITGKGGDGGSGAGGSNGTGIGNGGGAADGGPGSGGNATAGAVVIQW